MGADRDDDVAENGDNESSRRSSLLMIGGSLALIFVAFAAGFSIAGTGSLTGPNGQRVMTFDPTDGEMIMALGPEDDDGEAIDHMLGDDGPSWWRETADRSGIDLEELLDGVNATAGPNGTEIHPALKKKLAEAFRMNHTKNALDKVNLEKLVHNAMLDGEVDKDGRHFKPFAKKGNLDEIRAAGKNARLTEQEWKMVEKRKWKAQQGKLNHQVQLKQLSMYFSRGDHYWKYARAKLLAANDVEVMGEQCFYNSTRRRQDFWSPLAGEWAIQGNPIPIYDAEFPGTDVSKCYAHKQKVYPLNKKKQGVHLWDHETKYDCGASSEMTLRLYFNPKAADTGLGEKGSCRLIPLMPELLLKRLKNRRIWFFGDYTLKQQYEALACNLALHKVRSGTSHAGKRTGGRSMFTTFGQGEATSIFYTYVGHYRKDPSVEAVNVEVEGLGDNIKREFGVNADVAQELKNAPSPHRIGVIDLADAIEERMEDFLATDVIVASFGADFEETREYQSSLLKFLRLYEENNERLPIVLWRELTAQHHLGFRGGDILQPLQKSNDGILIPEADAQPDAPLSTKYKSAIPVVRLEMTPGEKAARIKCGPIPFAEMEMANWRNKLANRLMEAAGIPIMRVWEATTKRHDWYKPSCPGGLCDRWGPCMYYCSPGVPTFLNEVLFTFLQGGPMRDAMAVRVSETIPEEAPPPPPAPPADDGSLVDRPTNDVSRTECHDNFEYNGIRMKGYCAMVDKMKQGKFPEFNRKGNGMRSPLEGVQSHFFIGTNKRQWKDLEMKKHKEFEQISHLQKKLKMGRWDN